MDKQNLTRMMLMFREYKQRIVYLIKKHESDFDIDIDLSCNPDCLDETGRLITIAGMLMEKMKIVLDDVEYKEYKEKLNVVKIVYIAIKALSPEEEFIINNKYLEGRIKHDSDIYTRPDFVVGRTKYFELKHSAWCKILDVLA